LKEETETAKKILEGFKAGFDLALCGLGICLGLDKLFGKVLGGVAEQAGKVIGFPTSPSDVIVLGLDLIFGNNPIGGDKDEAY